MMSRVVGHRIQPETFAARQAFRSHDDQVTSMVGEKTVDLMSNVQCQRVLIVRYNPATDCQCMGLHWQRFRRPQAPPVASSTPNKVTRVPQSTVERRRSSWPARVPRSIDRNGDVFDGVVVVSDQQWAYGLSKAPWRRCPRSRLRRPEPRPDY